MKGAVIIYDCSTGKLVRLCEFQCLPEESADEVTSCTYCPTTAQLLVSLKGGTVLALKIRDRELARGAGDDKTSAGETLDRVLTPKDFDDILDLVGVSPVGVPFSCSSHIHWKEISLLQLNRRSPLHMNMAPEVGGEGRRRPPNARRQRSNMDNSKILQYEPPVEQPASGKYVRAMMVWCTHGDLSMGRCSLLQRS